MDVDLLVAFEVHGHGELGLCVECFNCKFRDLFGIFKGLLVVLLGRDGDDIPFFIRV